MAMARADKNGQLMNLPFFGDVDSFCMFPMNWPLVGVARMAMAYVCHLFACKLFMFSRFWLYQSIQTGQLKLTKTASADRIRCAAARAGQVDRNATHFLSRARCKWTRIGLGHRFVSARSRCPKDISNFLRHIGTILYPIWTVCVEPWILFDPCPSPLSVWVRGAPSGETHFN
jgi:hypothetical protein